MAPPETELTAHRLDRIGALPADQWDACAGIGNPFVSHAFLDALEISGCVSAETGWQPCHLALYRSNDPAPVAVMPLYLKGHSLGEYVFDQPWAAAFERAGGRYYPKVQSSVPFSPVTAPRLLVRPDMDGTHARTALLKAATGLTESNGLSSLHLTFLNAMDLRACRQAGLLHRTDQQFHWFNRGYDSFEGFLGAMASRKRKQIRKERRTALGDGLEITHKSGHDLTPADWDHFFDFYLDTANRKWGRPYLNRSFFEEIGARLGDRLLLMLAGRPGEAPIAGALNLVGEDALYGRYWGCREDHPCLHFETCYYQAIDVAIDRGLARVEAGAQGGHKLARGYEPVTTHSAHWLVDPGFREAVARYLDAEQQEVAAEQVFLNARTPFRKGDG
ncbi:GNAT family N-acetyltransferase [Yunchengibacter salinarum]|uniref:GNAT family N-acetyltransferase n=1 Tax=Yunchengibacter salinarum TaxID=3133399 RepID=UPI0035B5D0F3